MDFTVSEPSTSRDVNLLFEGEFGDGGFGLLVRRSPLIVEDGGR